MHFTAKKLVECLYIKCTREMVKRKKKTSQQKGNKDANNFLQGQQPFHKVSNNLELAPQTRPRILAR
jgi:hypothetical protein